MGSGSLSSIYFINAQSGQQKPSLRRKKRGVKWIGRPAGDDGKYQEWYRYGEVEGEIGRSRYVCSNWPYLFTLSAQAMRP